jgi:hypothetical protein
MEENREAFYEGLESRHSDVQPRFLVFPVVWRERCTTAYSLEIASIRFGGMQGRQK